MIVRIFVLNIYAYRITNYKLTLSLAGKIHNKKLWTTIINSINRGKGFLRLLPV